MYFMCIFLPVTRSYSYRPPKLDPKYPGWIQKGVYFSPLQCHENIPEVQKQLKGMFK